MVDCRQSALLAVCGAHLAGQPLHGDLRALGAELETATRTAPVYRMVALPGALPRPGLIRCTDGGAAFEVEVYRLPVRELGPLLLQVAAPLAIGSVLLENGSTVLGFVCEAYAEDGARDVTGFRGWRDYLAALAG